MRLPKHLTPKFRKKDKVFVKDIGTIYVNRSKWLLHEEEWRDVRTYSGVLSPWTYLDKIRKDQIGKIGIIKQVEFSGTVTDPRTSRFSYRVKFKGHARPIVFQEEYLTKRKGAKK